MGDKVLPKLDAATPSLTREQINLIVDALQGHILPRNNFGDLQPSVFDLGSRDYPFNAVYANNIIGTGAGGGVGVESFAPGIAGRRVKNYVVSGRVTDGRSDYLVGDGSEHCRLIAGTTDITPPFVYVINGQQYEIDTPAICDLSDITAKPVIDGSIGGNSSLNNILLQGEAGGVRGLFNSQGGALDIGWGSAKGWWGLEIADNEMAAVRRWGSVDIRVSGYRNFFTKRASEETTSTIINPVLFTTIPAVRTICAVFVRDDKTLFSHNREIATVVYDYPASPENGDIVFNYRTGEWEIYTGEWEVLPVCLVGFAVYGGQWTRSVESWRQVEMMARGNFTLPSGSSIRRISASEKFPLTFDRSTPQYGNSTAALFPDRLRSDLTHNPIPLDKALIQFVTWADDYEYSFDFEYDDPVTSTDEFENNPNPVFAVELEFLQVGEEVGIYFNYDAGTIETNQNYRFPLVFETPGHIRQFDAFDMRKQYLSSAKGLSVTDTEIYRANTYGREK